MAEQHFEQKLSFSEKAGYSCADAAANFVFMSMILFQANFYTDIFGMTASAAAAILLWPRLWDAVADPIVGILADRTNTRWGKFRPWILGTTIPWVIVMILAYHTPQGWSTRQLIAYAIITNTLMMSIYSMNNMPYSALGGVMTGDVNERAKLNSYRFVAVNAAQFIVGTFTLTLIGNFAHHHAGKNNLVVLADKQYGWQMVMTLWAGLCFVLFLITFFSTKERIKPVQTQTPAANPQQAGVKFQWRMLTAVTLLIAGFLCWSIWRFGQPVLLRMTDKQLVIQLVLCFFTILAVLPFLLCLWRALPDSVQSDFRNLVKNNPWKVMFLMTLVHFAILSFRGGALYNYYHHYADKAAMFDWVQSLGLTAPALPPGQEATGILDKWLGFIVHGDRDHLADSNVADVANSIINGLGTAVTILFIILTASFARRFGKKAVAVTGFALATVTSLAFYALSPTNIKGMVLITVLTSIVYAPTIALIWAIYADVADYSEWKTSRRFTGMVFATIGFALKSGLALGSASFLWILSGLFDYDTKLPDAENAVRGYRACSGIVVGILFGVCTLLLILYPLGKKVTLQMADELAERRRKASPQSA